MTRPPTAQPDTLPNLNATFAYRTRADGQRPFLTFYDHSSGERTELSVATFENWVAKTANLLVEEFDVGHGDRVATVVGSHWTQVVIAFGAWRAGATVVLCDPDVPGAEPAVQAGALAAAGVSVAFVREDAGIAKMASSANAAVMAVGTGLGARLTGDAGDAGDALGYAEEVTAFADDFDGDEADPGSDALVAFAPVAGDEPAGVRLSRRSIFSAAAAVGAWGLAPDDRLACLRPSGTVEGLVLAHLGAFFAGASVVLSRGSDAAGAGRLLRQERATLALVAAADLEPLGAAAETGGLQGVLSVDGVAAAEAAGRVRLPFPVSVGHGPVEAARASALTPADVGQDTRTWLDGVGSPCVGSPLADVEYTVLDAGAPGEAAGGELAVRGPVLMSGYLDRPDLDERVFAGGWLRTGQRGFVETGPDGRPYVFVTG